MQTAHPDDQHHVRDAGDGLQLARQLQQLRGHVCPGICVAVEVPQRLCLRGATSQSLSTGTMQMYNANVSEVSALRELI